MRNAKSPSFENHGSAAGELPESFSPETATTSSATSKQSARLKAFVHATTGLTFLLTASLAVVSAQGAPPLQGQLLYFNFDENTSDSSPLHHAVSLGCMSDASAAYGVGFEGQSLFQGQGMALPCILVTPNVVNGVSDFENFTQLSLAVWAKKENPDSSGYVIHKPKFVDFGDFKDLYSLKITADGFQVHLGDFNPIELSYTSDTVGTDWHHYAMTYDGTTVRLYLDGVQVTSARYAQSFTTGLSAMAVHLGYFAKDPFYGWLDELVVYDRALSPSEVQTMGSVPTPPTPEIQIDQNTGSLPLAVRFDGRGSDAGSGTIASYLWDFGDGSVGQGPVISHTFTDAGLFEVTLRVANSLGRSNSLSTVVRAYPAPHPELLMHLNFDENIYDWSGLDRRIYSSCSTSLSPEFEAGRVGNALHNQPGVVSPCILVNADGLQGMDQITLAGWHKKDHPEASGYIFFKPEYTLQVLPRGISASLTTSGGSIQLDSTVNNQDTNWHHYAITYDGRTLKFYWDGQLDSSQPQTGNIPAPDRPVDLIIGTLARSSLTGWIDELRIYGKALAASEIEMLPGMPDQPEPTKMPRLTISALANPVEIGISLEGEPGRSWIIQGIAHWNTGIWEDLGVIETDATGGGRLTLTRESAFSQQFFRAVQR